jgi:indolepyruvate ferredoxin oxidoreductase beta subunit
LEESSRRPVSILVAALGGEGGGVLAEWLVVAATRAGFAAQSTSIPGVAQRTGATTYYVEIDPVPAAARRNRAPILSLLPVPGALDLFVASELLEAARVAAAGFPSAERTRVVASTSRALTTAEKMALGDGRFESDRLLEALSATARSLVAFDMDALARSAGTVVSAVMFGAIAASGLLPCGREACEAAVRDVGIGVDASLRGFAAGFDATLARPGRSVSEPAAQPTLPAAARAAADAFPEPARRVIALGHQRVTDFQDARYADRYVARLRLVDAAERNADPRGAHGHALLRETARHLALWMAFDDVVRVAQLKSAPDRQARIRAESGAGDGDVVRVVDFFKPGMAEIAGLLPPALSRRLAAWDAGRKRRGKPGFAVALHLRSDAATGHTALRALAALRRLRPRSARFHDEQLAIDAWLDAVLAGAGEDWAVGYEVAQCGRLIKGYGATNERGRRNLAHILAHVAAGSRATAGERAAAIAVARNAALADEGGATLDRVLAAQGAPPRPLAVAPIVWHPRPGPGRRGP